MKVKVKVYDIYFFLITLFKALGYEANNNIYVLVFAFGCTVVLLKMFSEKYTLREILALVIILGIGLVNWIIGDFSSVLTTAIAICGLKHANPKRLIRISFWVRLAAFSLMILLSAIGLVENREIEFYRNGEYIVRYTFGYSHPNTAHIMFAIIVLLSLYLYGVKMHVGHYVLIICTNLGLYFFTGSRTGMLMIWMSMLCYLLISWSATRTKVAQIFRHVYIILLVITLLFGYGYEHVPFLKTLDSMMTGRIYYINRILMEEPIPLIGKAHYSSIIVDNGYIELLYMGGLVVFSWFSYYIIKMLSNFYRDRRVNELFLTTCFLIYNFAESFVELIAVNVSLVFLGELIFTSGEGGNEKDHNIYSNIQ